MILSVGGAAGFSGIRHGRLKISGPTEPKYLPPNQCSAVVDVDRFNSRDKLPGRYLRPMLVTYGWNIPYLIQF